MLLKSSLGKILRAKVRKLFDNGEYRDFEDSRNLVLKAFKAARCQKPASLTERIIVDALHNVVEINEEVVGVESSVFEFGVTSTDLFTLKKDWSVNLGCQLRFPWEPS